MNKNLEKLEEDQEGDGVYENDRAQETCDRALERLRRGSNAPAFARKRRRSITGRSSAPVREAQTSRSPILEVFSFRVL